MKIKLFFFISVLLVLPGNQLISQSERVEYEIRFAVPDNMVDSIWQYLSARYTNNNFFLKETDTLFNIKTAEDIFTDQYFDNKNFELLKAHIGVRHRARQSLSNLKDKKSGRELVQIKVSSEGSNEVARQEFKFPVKHYKKKKKPFDEHPLIGLVKRKKRGDLIGQLSELGISAEALFPTVKIVQNRKRIYIYHDTLAFGTVTLDNATAQYAGEKVNFVELEMELNEINYTKADPEERLNMEQINDQIKTDILIKFPRLTQDQTPKYNKAALKMTFYKSLFTSPLFIVVYIIAALSAAYVFWRKKKAM